MKIKAYNILDKQQKELTIKECEAFTKVQFGEIPKVLIDTLEYKNYKTLLKE